MQVATALSTARCLSTCDRLHPRDRFKVGLPLGLKCASAGKKPCDAESDGGPTLMRGAGEGKKFRTAGIAKDCEWH